MSAPKWFKLIQDNYIYIYHGNDMTDGEYVLIPNWPDQMRDSMSSTFNSTNALSRSAPVWSYAYSGPRTVDLTVDLHRDMLQLCNLNISNLQIDDFNEDYVDVLIRKLQSVSVPKYESSTKSVQPPQVAVRFGNEIFIKGIVTGSINVSYSKPVLDNGKYAVVSLNFSITETDPYDAATIKEQGSFRGITSSWLKGPYK